MTLPANPNPRGPTVATDCKSTFPASHYSYFDSNAGLGSIFASTGLCDFRCGNCWNTGCFGRRFVRLGRTVFGRQRQHSTKLGGHDLPENQGTHALQGGTRDGERPVDCRSVESGRCCGTDASDADRHRAHSRTALALEGRRCSPKRGCKNQRR